MNRTIFSLALLSSLAVSSTVFAQRDPIDRSDRQAQRQAALQNMTPDQRARYFQNRWQERYNSATPDQRAQMDAMRSQMNSAMQAQGLDPNNPQAVAQFMQNGGMRALRGGNNQEAQMRAMMNAVGITDKATQDPIITYVLQRRREQQPVLQLARDVATLLRAPVAGAATATQTSATPGTASATPVADSTIAQKFAAYGDALDKDKTLQTSELAALDKQISYSTKPRVQAFLSLVGILNPDALALGGVSAIFAPPSTNPVRPTNTSTQG